MDHNYDGFFVLYLLNHAPAPDSFQSLCVRFFTQLHTVHHIVQTKDYGLFSHLIMIFKRCLALSLLSLSLSIRFDWRINNNWPALKNNIIDDTHSEWYAFFQEWTFNIVDCVHGHMKMNHAEDINSSLYVWCNFEFNKWIYRFWIDAWHRRQASGCHSK